MIIKLLRLSEIAFISQENGRSKILHQDGKRVQTITLNVRGKGLNEFYKHYLIKEIGKIKLSPGNYFEITGSAAENAKSKRKLNCSFDTSWLSCFITCLYIAFGSLLNLGLTLINLTFRI